MRLRDALSLLAFSLAASGCGGDAPPAKTPAAAAHEEHRAPHGGAILELGEEEAHVEVVHDPKAGVLTLYVFGKDLNTPAEVAVPTILLATKSGPKEFKPTALDAKPGKDVATAWRLTDPAVAVDPLDGRLVVTVAGKEHRSPLEPSGHGN